MNQNRVVSQEDKQSSKHDAAQANSRKPRTLDEQTIASLVELFSGMSKPVSVVTYGQQHEKYPELIELLQDLQLCSKLIVLEEGKQVETGEENGFAETGGLGLKIFIENRYSGVSFAGIPGGHEFSSLVLALLQAVGLGKALDGFVVRQVSALNGPVRLRTFVSLSCENCPDIVQMLNQMALTQSSQGGTFENTMIDGDLAQAEVKRLKIGAVPAVFSGDRLIATGKVTVLEMLEKLRDAFGTKPAEANPSKASAGQDFSFPVADGAAKIVANETAMQFDLLVVGGGPAGISAAIYAARKGLRTALVAERLGGQVADTQGIENMISIPYTVGPQLVADFAKHLASYDVQVFEHRRVEGLHFDEEAAKASLSSGEEIGFARLIFATGAKWRELKVPGEKEYLGRGVAFCPHCDGPLYKNKRVAVIGGGNSGVEAALDLAAICSEVTLFEYAAELKADQVLVTRMKKTKNISVVTNAATTEIVGNGQSVTGLRYRDRNTDELKTKELDGVFVQIGLVPNSRALQGHVEINPNGEIVIDAKGRTSRKGVYAAGDVTTVPYKQIVVSVGEGAKAALAAFEDHMMA